MKIPSKKTRLQVYKKSLEFLELKFDQKHEIYGFAQHAGLCLVLPSVWLNCNYIINWKDFDGNYFGTLDVPKYFPEFGEYYPSEYYIFDEEYRIKILKEIIESMTAKVKSSKSPKLSKPSKSPKLSKSN